MLLDASDKVLLLLLLWSSLSMPIAKADFAGLFESIKELADGGGDDSYQLKPNTFSHDCIDSINRRRLSLGLNLLRYDQKLAEIAQKRANLLADGAFAKPSSSLRNLNYWIKEQGHQNMDQSWSRRSCQTIISGWCRQMEVNASHQYLETRDEEPNCPYVTRARSHRIGCAQTSSPDYGFFTVCQFNEPAKQHQAMGSLQFQDQLGANTLSRADVAQEEDEEDEGLEMRATARQMVRPGIPNEVDANNNTNEACNFSLTREWNKLRGDEKRLVLRRAINWHMKASGMTRFERVMLGKMIDKHDGGLIEDY